MTIFSTNFFLMMLFWGNGLKELWLVFMQVFPSLSLSLFFFSFLFLSFLFFFFFFFCFLFLDCNFSPTFLSEDNFHKRLEEVFSPSGSPSLLAFASLQSAVVYVQDAELTKEILGNFSSLPLLFPFFFFPFFLFSHFSTSWPPLGLPPSFFQENWFFFLFPFLLLSLFPHCLFLDIETHDLVPLARKCSQTITTLLTKKGKEKTSFLSLPEQLSDSFYPHNVAGGEDFSFILSLSLKLLVFHQGFFFSFFFLTVTFVFNLVLFVKKFKKRQGKRLKRL